MLTCFSYMPFHCYNIYYLLKEVAFVYNRQSLRSKLLLILILFAVIPIFIASTINIVTNLSAVKNSTIQSNLNTAKQAANQIKTLLDDSKGITELLASDPTTKSMNAAAINELILAAQKSNPQFELIYVMDKTGMQIARTSGNLANRADRAYFKEALAGKLFITDTYISSFTNAPTVTISTPIKNGVGEIIGVVAADISLKSLAKISQQVHVGQTGYMDIVDSKGIVLAHPDQQKVLNKDNFIQYDYVKQATEGKSGNIEAVSTRGDKTLTVFTPVENYNWGIIIHEPTLEVYRAVINTGIISLLIMLLFIGLAIAAAFHIIKGIVAPINKLIEASNFVAKGDLTKNISVSGVNEVEQLANAFNSMLDSLRNLVSASLHVSTSIAAASAQLATSTEEVGKASHELAHNISEVSEGSAMQLRLADESSQTITAMLKSAEQTTDIANEVAHLSQQSEKTAEIGARQISLAIEKMNTLQQDVGAITEMIHSLGNKSRQIGQIVEVITGIAGQTNLLALNAAIEAARAGEHGKGFAVVAEEVRKLAEQSGAAAKEIAQIINTIQTETASAVQSMDKGNQEVTEGVQVVEASGAAFKEIFTAIKKMHQAIAEISAAAEIQRTNTHAVNEAVTGIVQSAQANAANSEQIAAASEEQNAAVEEITAATASLAKMSADLKTTVNKFII